MDFWQKRGPLALTLWPLSLIFRGLAGLRRRLYRHGLLKSYRAPVPVIVVGNISVGGTGKTPVVIALLEYLKAQGWHPGVVSRGYGGSHRGAPLLLGAATTAAQSGDEPALIRERSGCPVCVGSDRAAAVQTLLAGSDTDVIITDDGLQHYRLQRDVEIVVCDAQRGHGNGFCLPAGPLREPVSRLHSVDYVLQNSGSVARPDLPGNVYLRPDTLRPLNGLGRDPQTLGPQPVFAVAGTASPARFFATLAQLGFSVTPVVFPDHHAFCAQDFAALQGMPLVMTEKDAVKCRDLGLKDAWVLPVSAQLPETLTELLAQRLSGLRPASKGTSDE
ncbi:tetraacyldisaccharide 4'-kinase [Granulosicoccaceae sp. 1_MG-2023]|nr:tetraacyldisaccharide 4'-kinase [Granulosicoccaceae sp. 1_MG-2023]